MLELFPYDPKDILNIQQRTWDEYIPVSFEMLSKPAAYSMAAFTLKHKEEVVAVTGVMGRAPGVLEAWFIGSTNITRFARGVYALCYSLLHQVSDQFGARRIEANVHHEHQPGIKFVNNLGFHYEGVAVDYYGYGEPAYRYAWLKEGH